MSIKIKGGGGDLTGSRTTKKQKREAAKTADKKDVSASQKVSTINRINSGDRQDLAFKAKPKTPAAPVKSAIKSKSKSLAKYEDGTKGIRITPKNKKVPAVELVTGKEAHKANAVQDSIDKDRQMKHNQKTKPGYSVTNAVDNLQSRITSDSTKLAKQNIVVKPTSIKVKAKKTK